MACHLVELHVEWPIEFSQPLYYFLINVRVGPTFCLAQAVGLAAAFSLFQAWEPLGFVEVEMFICDDPLEAQKVLDAAQLACWITDQSLPTDKKDLPKREVQEPIF